MFIPVSDWLPAFLLTLLVEVPVVVLLLARDRADRPRVAALAVFANLATHPAVWFVFSQLFLIGTISYTLAAETWAVAIEALFYAVAIGVGWRRAAMVSVAANLASFVVGRIVFALLPGGLPGPV